MSLLPGDISPTGYLPDVTLTLDKAEGILAALVNLETSCPWWIGDLLNWAEKQFGEEWSQIVCKLTQVQWDTVRRYRQVASAYPPEERVEGASFSHHRELMNLPSDRREHWLAKTVTENLSVREVRQLRYVEETDKEQKPPYPPDLMELIRQVGFDLLRTWDTDSLPPDYSIGREDGSLITVSVRIRKPL